VSSRQVRKVWPSLSLNDGALVVCDSPVSVALRPDGQTSRNPLALAEQVRHGDQVVGEWPTLQVVNTPRAVHLVWGARNRIQHLLSRVDRAGSSDFPEVVVHEALELRSRSWPSRAVEDRLALREVGDEIARAHHAGTIPHAPRGWQSSRPGGIGSWSPPQNTPHEHSDCVLFSGCSGGTPQLFGEQPENTIPGYLRTALNASVHTGLRHLRKPENKGQAGALRAPAREVPGKQALLRSLRSSLRRSRVPPRRPALRFPRWACGAPRSHRATRVRVAWQSTTRREPHASTIRRSGEPPMRAPAAHATPEAWVRRLRSSCSWSGWPR
jgi:hypothetical protein